MTKKRCSKCGRLRLRSEFYRSNARYDDGCTRWCKECMDRHDREYAAENAAAAGPPVRRSTKWCNECKRYRGVECFNVDRTSPDWRQYRCRECERAARDRKGRVRCS